jgi:hypothetical protein
VQTKAKTRSDQEEGNRHSVGDDVFVFSSVSVSFPATILKVLDYSQYEVQGSDDPTDTNVYRFPKERILIQTEEDDKTLSSSPSMNILDALG